MKKILFLLLAWIVFFSSTKKTYASDYTVDSFVSKILINKDRSLIVDEKIDVNFKIKKHGIFRIIPYRQIMAVDDYSIKIKVISVVDKNGGIIPYRTNKNGDDIRITIGDGNKLIEGKQTYNIKYLVNGAMIENDNDWQLYWNTSGSKWDTQIESTSAIIDSPFYKITNIYCYAGTTKSNTELCSINRDKNKYIIYSQTKTGFASDLTIKALTEKPTETPLTIIINNVKKIAHKYYLYALLFLPFLTTLIFWYTNGRDKRYIGSNIYTEYEKEENVPLINFEYLPSSYYPITGYSPLEIGTIQDETINSRDIVAEIIELARLGYLTIVQTETKKLFTDNCYLITKTKEDTSLLKNHQKIIFNAIFTENITSIKSSDFDANFIREMEKAKESVYISLTEDNKIFYKNPNLIRTIAIVLNTVAYILIGVFFSINNNDLYAEVIYPILGTLLLSISIYFSYFLPRKTAKGYSILRQIKGLKHYLKIGKWRQEIAEKNIFLDEMLPIAISLGVVGNLVKDMKEIGANVPVYFQSTSINTFSSEINSFSKIISAAITPQTSGSSSSGFSGGGFGGGGGGSW